MNNEVIVLIANLALTLSFIVALVLGIAQVKTAARDRKERFTLDTLRNYQSPEFSELMHYVTSHDVPSTAEAWRKLPYKEQVTFLQFSQLMESLGLLVAERLINIDLVDKTLGSFVTSSWDKFKTGIMDLREKLQDPFLNEYFQWLAERLNERMEKNPRRPFHEKR